MASYDKLRAVIDVGGKSFADVLKTGLDISEVRVKEQEEIRKKGHAERYRKGYAEAERLYKVTYSCSVCGKTLTVTSGDEKEAIKKYIPEHGWGHSTCHERKQ